MRATGGQPGEQRMCGRVVGSDRMTQRGMWGDGMRQVRGNRTWQGARSSWE
jgi:hypothetical protein